MSAPDDELVEVVSEAIADVDVESDTAEFWGLYRDQARAVLSVPALRDALARDAQVRELLTSDRLTLAVAADIAALYPEVASMLRDGKG